jgi:hypothetical protein
MADAFAPETSLDTPAAARQLGVSESFLAKARMRGDGPRYSKFRRAVRYAPGDLEEYRLACSRTSTTEQAAVAGLVSKSISRARASAGVPSGNTLQERITLGASTPLR